MVDDRADASGPSTLRGMVMVNAASVRNKILTCCQCQYPKTEGLIVVVRAALGAGVGVLDLALMSCD